MKLKFTDENGKTWLDLNDWQTSVLVFFVVLALMSAGDLIRWLAN